MNGRPPDFPNPAELWARVRPYLWTAGAIGALAALALVSFQTYFQVEAGEEAILLRLGVPTGSTYGPGLHFRIPFVDEVYKVDVKKVHQLEFGFRTTRADVKSEFDEGSHETESNMLTGDLSLVHVQWTVFYRISNPEKYFFEVRDVEETIRDLSEAVMRLLVGDRSNDEVMTEHRSEIAQRARDMLQEKLDRCDSGVHVERVALRQVDPPPDAKAAFNKVNEARARQQQLVEQAKRMRVEAVEAARGERNAVVAEARGRAAQRTEEARGEALRFLAFLREYRRAPELTRRWMYFDTVGRALASADWKVVLGRGVGASDVQKVLPLAPLLPELGDAPSAPMPPAVTAPALPVDGAADRAAPPVGGGQ